MKVFLDESGTFARCTQRGSFCLVAAYVVSEKDYPRMEATLRKYKEEAGFSKGAEVKRSKVSEDVYFRMLHRLASIDGIALAVVTDASMNGAAEAHRDEQAQKIADNAPGMKYPEGKELVLKLADDVRSLSAQSYVELFCRTYLAFDVVNLAQLYFVQRCPETLSRFEWQFDRKDITPTRFETTVKHASIALMQSMSFREPMTFLEGADYSYFDRAFKTADPYPYWLPPLPPGRSHLSTNQIWMRDHHFVDSASSPGVQVADLIASGIRGCLRGTFNNNDTAAALLGRLMVGRQTGHSVLRFIALAEPGRPDEAIDRTVARRVHVMQANARGMIVAKAGEQI